jgi:hypothetical protein
MGAKPRLRLDFVLAKLPLKRTYDSRMEESKLGGKRRNSGRKTEAGVDGPVKKHTVTYDEMTERMLRVLGKGEVSRGIRRAARFAFDGYQNGRFNP